MATNTHSGGHLTSSSKLEDQAASAALYVTRDSGSGPASRSVLDEDGKLSSAGAASSLKYARPQDLPSFPSAGLQLSSAGAAASLADSNKKSFEHWKPGEIPASKRAALLAKDYEMDPLWQPEMSAAGSKAALLAHRDTKDIQIWKASESAEGQSAAGKALKTKGPNAITERNVGADGRHKALLAATGAMSGSRKRADSAPAKPDDKSWALKAATTSQRGTSKPTAFASGDPGFEAARIQNLAKNNVNRQMYGSNPPVALEVEEKNRQDTLRASAIAMAQKMYAIQQSHIDEAAGVKRSDSHAAANHVRQKGTSDASNSVSEGAVVAPRYENLEEAARKLAQERLAKMHDEHAEYRNYYGQAGGAQRSRLSVRLGRRASSGAHTDNSDEEQSRKIRSQMSLFQSKLQDVDSKKRQADRDALLVAAHKNVEARMAQLDERVFQETGKASPHQREMWEKSAREKAQKDSDERMQHMGKVHIGGGKYLDQSEVDAIARARLQPTFDDINEKAAAQRARDEEMRAKAEEARLEQERAKADAAKEKARGAEVKAELKAASEREKMELKAQRNAEKERLRLEKEEKRKSKDNKNTRLSTGPGRSAPTPAAQQTETEAVESGPVVQVGSLEGDTVHDQVTVPKSPGEEIDEPVRDVIAVPEDTTYTSVETTTVVPQASETVASPVKGDSKMRSWIRTKFSSGAKAPKGNDEGVTGTGVATGTPTMQGNEDETAKASSMKDVAMAGRTTSNETEDMYGGHGAISPAKEMRADRGLSRSSSISSIESSDANIAGKQPTSSDAAESDAEQRGRRGFKQRLLNKISSQKDKGKESDHTLVPTTTLTDDEEFEEARDTFEEEKLKPPPVLSSGKSSSPQGSRDRSKFTENL